VFQSCTYEPYIDDECNQLQYVDAEGVDATTFVHKKALVSLVDLLHAETEMDEVRNAPHEPARCRPDSDATVGSVVGYGGIMRLFGC
jgi:hypothetical protein